MKNQGWAYISTPQFEKDLQKSTLSREKIINKLHISSKKTSYKKGNKLKGNLKGIRAVRIGDYRTVFGFVDGICLLGAIGNRNDIYKKVHRREKTLREISKILEKLNLKSL